MQGFCASGSVERPEPSMTASFEDNVIRTIRALRPGEVGSYGEVAQESGSPRAARAVGALLARTADLPWWRVVRSDGRLVAPKAKLQARLLRREGVEVRYGRVVRGARTEEVSVRSVHRAPPKGDRRR